MNNRKHSLTLIATLLLAPLMVVHAENGRLLPTDWDPKRAGDEVLFTLIRVSAPQVKGAHDADLVLVGERAFVVEHDNDIKPGHGAGKAQYCVLTVVNVKTMRVERVVPMAKSAQAFANETLPVGACFVPRIIRLNDTTLRCFFACEDQSGKSQSQTWYRDFDIASLSFAPTIHRLKLKTSDGTFDMQPRYFHSDAAKHGFKEPAKSFGLYLLDAFKVIDGKTYLAINNFPGAQNALAMLNEARDTVEVIGHYNEPADRRLTESSVNRLPDGTWMAICRTESGDRNYVFTASKDGKTWTQRRAARRCLQRQQLQAHLRQVQRHLLPRLAGSLPHHRRPWRWSLHIQHRSFS